MEDLRRRVAEKKARGLYGVDALMAGAAEDDGEPFGLDELERLRDLAVQRVDLATAASTKPVVGGLLSRLKRLLVRGTSQPVYGLSAQATAFNGALLAYLSSLARQTSALERQVRAARGEAAEARGEVEHLGARLAEALARMSEAERQVTRMADAALPERVARLERAPAPPAPAGGAPAAPAAAAEGDPVRLRLEATEPGDGAARAARYADVLRGRGRIVHVGAGSGRALAALGEGAEGVESDAELAAAAAAEGRAVHHADPVAYLAALAPGSIGGVLVTDLVERLDGRALGRLAGAIAHALAPEGRVVVEALNPAATWAMGTGFWRDAGRRRPLHPDAVRMALEAAGLGSTSVELLDSPEDVRLDPTGLGELAPLAERLNEVLFGPRRYAVHAAR